MYLNVHNHVTKCIANADIITDPFSHIVIDNIFTEDLYKQLTQNIIPDNILATLQDYKRVGNGYSDARYILKLKSNMPFLEETNRLIWQNFAKYISNHFIHLILQKFKIYDDDLISDLLYVKDGMNYSLGPHTDKPSKVLTCLFYLPTDNQYKNYGTSIYIPKDINFICSGGPHYKRNDFHLYKTIEFLPNRLFCFLKSNKSFHGVEPVSENITRNLIIFDIQKIQC